MAAIAHAVLDGEHARFRSPGCSDDHLTAAAAIARNYGGGGDFEAFFVTTLDRKNVAVVQVRGDRFRFLIVPRELYQHIGDPFVIAQRFPANLADHGPIADLEWDVVVAKRRSLEDLQTILKSDDGPTLLGAVQALVDGGRVVFVRTHPDADVLRRLWQLLPDSAREELRIATFSPSNTLGFDLLVAPQPEPPCVTDEQAGDYPQGRYELALQVAVESGDEAELERLLSRRSARQAMRLMIRILVAALVIGLVIRVIGCQ
jgi:hypothetical protein